MLRTAKAQSMIPTSTPSPTTILTSVNSSGDYMCRTQLIPSSPNITYHPYKSPHQFGVSDENQQESTTKTSTHVIANKVSYHNIQTFSEQRLEKQQNLPYQKITPRITNDQNISTEQIINTENQYTKKDQERIFIMPNT